MWREGCAMRWFVTVTVTAVVFFLALTMVEGGRVLYLNPYSPKSHNIFHTAVVNALADEGNQVTLVTSFKSNQTKARVREVVVTNADIVPVGDALFQNNIIALVINMGSAAPTICSDTLAQPHVQSLLKEEFDVVVTSLFFTDCFLSLIYQLKVSYILTSPTGMYSDMASRIGSPQFPAFRGSIFLNYKHPLTFTERLIATFMETFMEIYFHYSVFPNVRTLESTGHPAVPAEVYCGGIHCRPAQPLPKDLEEWVEGAGEKGFIFFSLGSVIKPSVMPEKYRAVLVEVLGSLEQRVLWKWDQDTMADLPPNVRLAKWLPQQDILGDPRLRLFITHGGRLSTQEATYNGVPVVGIPFHFDQYNNMHNIENQGWGRYLLWEQLSNQTFRSAILQVINDESMLREARHRAVLMRDQPQTPAEVATFWVQYVMRHKGAPHLRCPALTMPWYQLYNVDVWATVVAMVVAVIYLFIRLLVALFSRLCCFKAKDKRD